MRYGKFIEAYARSVGRKPDCPGDGASPMNLWVSGKPRWRRQFGRDVESAFGKQVAKLAAPDAGRYLRSVRANSGDGPGSVDSRVVDARRTLRLRKAPILLLDLPVRQLVDEALLLIDPLIDDRYRRMRTTIILSDHNPAEAYKSAYRGQEPGVTMPRILGRILELGDAVEVMEDGVFCCEFLWDADQVCGDYRVEILCRRTGRVAIVRNGPPDFD